MKRRLEFLIFLFGAVLLSCSKEEMDFDKYVGLQGKIDPGIIRKETIIINRQFNVFFPKVEVYHSAVEEEGLWTPELIVKNIIDIHLEILPIYVFGEGNISGDYYAVSGYAVSHNASAFSVKKISGNVEMMGWYMSTFGFDFQLLDEKGNAVNNQDVTFYVTPEPSTTIGSTTYKKGYSFSLSPALTLGRLKKQDEGEEAPTWKNTILGIVSFGFDCENSSTQILPDQSVLMWTGPNDRMTSYEFKTNNLGKGVSPSAVPGLFRTDQRVDFSWVWRIRGGAYSAKDRCFGNMKMKVNVKPQYGANVRGEYYFGKAEKKMTYIDKNRILSTNQPSSFSFDLPSINRIPTGDFSLKNCTRSYLKNLKIYRTGEYGKKDPYLSVDCSCDQNESVSSILREGIYDFYYELVNGDTGESRGLFVITESQVKPGEKLVLTTFDAKQVLK